MRIKQLHINGFKSFKVGSTLQFPAEPGLFLVRGENRVHKALGANGTGKSTLWDALTWCLYGKTPRGLRASGVLNWEMEGNALARVDFEVNGRNYRVTRSQSPNVLALQEGSADSRPVKQEELDQLFGLDFDGWLSCVVMAQFGTHFFDLSPSQKLETFSQALNLGCWEAAGKKATAEAAALSTELQAKQITSSSVQGALTTDKASLVRLKQDSQAFEVDRTADVENCTRQLTILAEQTATLKAKLAAIPPLTDGTARQELSSKMIGIDVALRQLLDVRGKTAGSLQFLEGSLNTLKRERTKVASEQGPKFCPTCKKEMGTIDHTEHLRSVDADIAKADEEVAKRKEQLARENKAVETAQQELANLQGALKGAEDAYRVAAQERNQLQQQETQAQTRIKELTALTRRTVERANPFVANIEQTEQRITVKEKEAKELETLIVALNGMTLICKQWTDLFKQLRLWLVDQALIQLELEVNNSLLQLGMTGWRVSFDVEREKATGGIARGFTVNILAPNNPNPVDWAAWSGGETQRLRIAGTIGLSNMLKMYRGLEVPLEVWDEPTAHLSTEGVMDLLTFFEQRARESNRQIWLVDHQSLDFGGFTGELLVYKDGNGSHLEAVNGIPAHCVA